ncbi:hypothetical protein K438DRAFT_1772872 [Mycena galopus ATCC 62051]|nr:hypothetical protein K438DRAFT_1772872 [Mycena galopus ATCC 62051]
MVLKTGIQMREEFCWPPASRELGTARTRIRRASRQVLRRVRRVERGAGGLRGACSSTDTTGGGTCGPLRRRRRRIRCPGLSTAGNDAGSSGGAMTSTSVVVRRLHCVGMQRSIAFALYGVDLGVVDLDAEDEEGALKYRLANANVFGEARRPSAGGARTRARERSARRRAWRRTSGCGGWARACGAPSALACDGERARNTPKYSAHSDAHASAIVVAEAECVPVAGAPVYGAGADAGACSKGEGGKVHTGDEELGEGEGTRNDRRRRHLVVPVAVAQGTFLPPLVIVHTPWDALRLRREASRRGTKDGSRGGAGVMKPRACELGPASLRLGSGSAWNFARPGPHFLKFPSQKPWLGPKPGLFGAWLGLGLGVFKAEPKPKPGLSGQAQAGTSLGALLAVGESVGVISIPLGIGLDSPLATRTALGST